MAYEVFDFRPQLETPASVNFKVLSAQFGDGYKQSVANGINNRTENWDLSFRGKRERIEQIRAFLDARKGAEPFYWTPKNGDQLLFDCDEYRVTNESDTGSGSEVWRLTATFNQRYAP